MENSASLLNDKLAARLRGFGPLGILAILIILGGNVVVAPLSAILILIWVKLSGTPWRDIGYVRPRSWIRTNDAPSRARSSWSVTVSPPS